MPGIASIKGENDRKKPGYQVPAYIDEVTEVTSSVGGNGHFPLFTSFTARENARNGLLRKPPRPPGRAGRYDFTQRAVPSETPLLIWFIFIIKPRPSKEPGF